MKPLILPARDMAERAKTEALAETVRLISVNVSHGAVQLHSYPDYVNAYLDLELSAAGYKVKPSFEQQRLLVSWSPA